MGCCHSSYDNSMEESSQQTVEVTSTTDRPTVSFNTTADFSEYDPYCYRSHINPLALSDYDDSSRGTSSKETHVGDESTTFSSPGRAPFQPLLFMARFSASAYDSDDPEDPFASIMSDSPTTRQISADSTQHTVHYRGGRLLQLRSPRKTPRYSVVLSLDSGTEGASETSGLIFRSFPQGQPQAARVSNPASRSSVTSSGTSRSGFRRSIFAALDYSGHLDASSMDSSLLSYTSSTLSNRSVLHRVTRTQISAFLAESVLEEEDLFPSLLSSEVAMLRPISILMQQYFDHTPISWK